MLEHLKHEANTSFVLIEFFIRLFLLDTIILISNVTLILLFTYLQILDFIAIVLR